MIKDIKNILIKLLLIVVLIVIYLVIVKYQSNDTNINNRNINLTNDNLKVYFIDVGEADCILIDSNGEYAVIDGGNTIDGNKVVKYLKSLNVKDIKYVFGTHAHEDHIGGLANIIYNFNIGKYYTSNVPSEYKSYYNVQKALNKKNLELNNPNNNDEYKLGESTIKVLYNGANEEDINNSSLILKLVYKNTSFLFTGDSTKEVEEKLLDNDLKSNVLKVSHHGSNDASGANFLVKVHPEYAIISVGKNNEYYHPHQVTIDKLERLNTKIYRTDLDGTIIVASDGNNIEVNTTKTDTNKEE